MIKIQDLLLKFNNLLVSENLKIDALKKVLSDVVNLKIKNEDIKIKKGTVYLNIKPIYKNEIFLKREEIFSELEKILGKKTPQEFR